MQAVAAMSACEQCCGKKSSKVPIFSNIPAHNSDWYANVDGTAKLQCALLATVYIYVNVYVGPSLPSPFIIMWHTMHVAKLLNSALKYVVRSLLHKMNGREVKWANPKLAMRNCSIITKCIKK